eukprot:Platyproteum_vivax@DN6130_c0_g1_i1.p1
MAKKGVFSPKVQRFFFYAVVVAICALLIATFFYDPDRGQKKRYENDFEEAFQTLMTKVEKDPNDSVSCLNILRLLLHQQKYGSKQLSFKKEDAIKYFFMKAMSLDPLPYRKITEYYLDALKNLGEEGHMNLMEVFSSLVMNTQCGLDCLQLLKDKAYLWLDETLMADPEKRKTMSAQQNNVVSFFKAYHTALADDKEGLTALRDHLQRRLINNGDVSMSHLHNTLAKINLVLLPDDRRCAWMPLDASKPDFLPTITNCQAWHQINFALMLLKQSDAHAEAEVLYELAKLSKNMNGQSPFAVWDNLHRTPKIPFGNMLTSVLYEEDEAPGLNYLKDRAEPFIAAFEEMFNAENAHEDVVKMRGQGQGILTFFTEHKFNESLCEKASTICSILKGMSSFGVSNMPYVFSSDEGIHIMSITKDNLFRHNHMASNRIGYLMVLSNTAYTYLYIKDQIVDFSESKGKLVAFDSSFDIYIKNLSQPDPRTSTPAPTGNLQNTAVYLFMNSHHPKYTVENFQVFAQTYAAFAKDSCILCQDAQALQNMMAEVIQNMKTSESPYEIVQEGESAEEGEEKDEDDAGVHADGTVDE